MPVPLDLHENLLRQEIQLKPDEIPNSCRERFQNVP
jgi:hypothetical protein